MNVSRLFTDRCSRALISISLTARDCASERHTRATFSIVGLPAMVVREAKERVRAALLNSQFEFPAGRITVNLAPADLPKEGGRFDLPIALGVLLASGQLTGGASSAGTAPREFYGELGLTGELKAVRGLLPAAAQARCAGHELIVPRANVAEACVVAPQLG